ncbi:hypothetical protein JI58_01315 [Marinosulfonomonas sp. PRT-SC04]|nr:hypothetical protein JI58_01315 [Marinosulfonomonas sp. PRT-SC04]
MGRLSASTIFEKEPAMADKQIKLKITSAIVIGGEIIVAGTTVTVAEALAKNLMHRGRAELLTASGKGGGEKSVAELKVIAEGLEIDGAANMKKAELIEAIEAAQSE